MNNKTGFMDQNPKNRTPDWMYDEIQEEDFLLGKTPKDLGDSWEEEE